MKKFTKLLSVVLAVMMIMCAVSALSFSASAAETSAKTATIYFAAPRGTGIANSWRNAQLYYGSTTTVGKLARIDMERTGKVYAGDKGSLTTIVSDDWDVYSLKLTAAQIQAVDSAKYVGFINANNRKTGLKNSICKATATGTYASTKSSITAYDGKMFVINGCYDVPNEITTYNVKVLSGNTGKAPAKSPVTIYFAAPLGTTTANNWSSANLFYGNDQKSLKNNTKVPMTKTGDTYAGDKGKLTTLVSGDWDIYSVTLNAEQINRIDYAKYVGFVNGYSRKTGYANPLQKATESGKYSDVPLSIADYDGKMFIINGSYLGSEISSYTVKAVDYRVSEKNKINVTSNVGSASSCQYSSSDKKVTVTYTLDTDVVIENIQAVVNYDKNVLKLASTSTKKTISPVFYGTSGAGYVANLGLDSKIKFNATSLDGYDFAGGKTVFTAVFDIVGSGDTTVDFDIYMLTGIEDNKDVKMVYKDEVMTDNFTVTAKASV